MKRNTFITLSFIIALFIIGILGSDNKLIFINSVSNSAKADPIELDNWELSTVFYDSTVNSGQTPLTEINWDASDGGYGDGEPRTITVQINYKNTNTITIYNQNELIISIPNLAYNNNCWNAEIIVGANDNTHTGYDWNFKSNLTSSALTSPTTSQSIFYFTNNNTIDQRTNLEGSIQIKYLLTPRNESSTLVFYEEKLIKEYSKEIYASLNDTINSDIITFNYYREAELEWIYPELDLEKNAKKIISYDGLGENANDYIWVKYNFKINGDWHGELNRYPYYKVRKVYLNGVIPSDAIIYDENMEEVDVETDGSYRISIFSYTNPVSYNIIIGYLKDSYDFNDNSVILDTTNLYALYDDATELLQDTKDTEVDLTEFLFNYTGSLYEIKNYFKTDPYSNYKANYESLIGQDIEIGNKGIEVSSFETKVIFTGQEMDAVIGNDLLYITDSSNNYRKLDDSEYYFSKIYFPDIFINGNNQTIRDDKYNCELWVKKRNEVNYELEDQFYLNSKNTWDYEESDEVVAFYFVINNLRESLIKQDYGGYSDIVINNATNIKRKGQIYNSFYLKVYVDDELQNIATLDDYNRLVAKDEIANYDMEKNGTYIQRSISTVYYSEYTFPSITNYIGVMKSQSYSQDSLSESFKNQIYFSFGNTVSSPFHPSEHEVEYYHDQIEEEYLIEGWEIYDILPEGMELDCTKDEIINSISTNFSNNNRYYGSIYDSKNSFQRLTVNEYLELLKNNTHIEIIKNYKNSNRTYIKILIDLSQNPILLIQGSYSSIYYLRMKISTKISFNNYIEYGDNYNNYVYAKYHNRDIEINGFNISTIGSHRKINDIGEYEEIARDIDNNNNTEEKIIAHQSNLVITSVISTNQDVQTSVQTDKSNYDTGKVESSLDTNYSYKLRVRTGTNDVTNLVIYDSLEKYAKNPQLEIVEASGGRKAWHGELLGVDTTYAESKGYNVKVYYSTKEQPGTLKEDDSWQEYTDSVDKSTIKSFAFEYLDSNGNPAILPANSLTYVLINMKSPSEDLKYFTYNGCWTEWNAIDSVTGQPVDFITGINSNIVKVALPNSVEPEDKEITVTKNWSDNSDNLHIRPTSVNYKIIATNDDNVTINETITGNSDNNTWTDTVVVPKYNDDGVELTYTVEESNIELDNNYVYVSTVDGLTMTNKLNKKLTLEKIWKDNNNSYLTRPTNIEYNLLRNNNNYKTVTITGNYSNNTWSKDILVDVYDNSNNAYTYTIDEPSINDYVSSCEEFTCTNTLSKDTNIKVHKVWVDNNNEYDTRPDNIIVHLYRNNNLYKDIEIDNTWESNNISIPIYDNDGVKYSYRIEENHIDGYNEVSYNQDTYTITNTLKENITLTIKKTWIDDNNSDNTRPDNLSITLLQNDNEYQTLTLEGDSNEWVTTIEVPKYNSNQEKYTYSIKELNDDIKDIYSDITYSEEELSVTNKLNKNTKLTISKEWKDSDNLYKTRPKSTRVYLYQNDELYKELELTGDENTWTTTIEDVPMYDTNGKRYVYTIKEDINDKYGKAIYDQSNLSIVNELTDIPKVTLYFTVKNGYTLLNSNEIQYDEEGYRNILRSYNLDSEEEYTYSFKLRNIKTNKEYEGKLTTQGILEFKDIEYGTYRAIEEDDNYFSFVSMLSIEDIEGIEFTPDEKGGLITIKPTGKNIIYGANIINKIVEPIKNPPTITSIRLIKLFIIIMLSTIITYLLYKKTDKYILNN